MKEGIRKRGIRSVDCDCAKPAQSEVFCHLALCPIGRGAWSASSANDQSFGLKSCRKAMSVRFLRIAPEDLWRSKNLEDLDMKSSSLASYSSFDGAKNLDSMKAFDAEIVDKEVSLSIQQTRNNCSTYISTAVMENFRLSYEILGVLERFGRHKPMKTTSLHGSISPCSRWVGKTEFLPHVYHWVEKRQAVQLTMPAFPCKSASLLWYNDRHQANVYPCSLTMKIKSWAVFPTSAKN